MNTKQVADRLVSLCREGKYEEAQRELYADDAVSIEMPAMADGPIGNVQGLAAILKKGEDWSANISQIHGGSVGDPVVAGSWFALTLSIDATYKDRGRMAMDEICVYRVRDGKIAHEQFFYDVG
jgi:ketosteroid isomerase-like protein